MRTIDLPLQFVRALLVTGILFAAIGCEAGKHHGRASASLAGADTASARAGESLAAIDAATAGIDASIAAKAIANAAKATDATADAIAQIGSLADRGRAKPTAGTLDAIRREVGRGTASVAEARQQLGGAGLYVAKIDAAIATVRERIAAAVLAIGESRQQLASAQGEVEKSFAQAAETKRKHEAELTAERLKREAVEQSVGYRIEQGVRKVVRVTFWFLFAGLLFRALWLLMGGRVLSWAAAAGEGVGTFGISTIAQLIYKFGASRAAAKGTQS